MFKYTAMLVAAANAVQEHSQHNHHVYESYDQAYYDDYVDEYKYEHGGSDPHYYEPPHEESAYYGAGYDDEHYGNIPTGDFYWQVDDVNVWDEIWDQDDYESRLYTEAELMIVLESLRESLVDLDREIDWLDDCIHDNDDGWK